MNLHDCPHCGSSNVIIHYEYVGRRVKTVIQCMTCNHRVSSFHGVRGALQRWGEEAMVSIPTNLPDWCADCPYIDLTTERYCTSGQITVTVTTCTSFKKCEWLRWKWRGDVNDDTREPEKS